MNSASNSLPVLKEQVAKTGISSVTDRQWRERVLATRQESARSGMHAALVEMGSTVARYFTPEEKVTFSTFAQTLRAPMPAGAAREFAVPLVQAAGLAEREAAWRYELMMNSVLDRNIWMGQMTEFVQLQRQRLKFAELAGQLEGFAPRVMPEFRSATLLNAAEAYRAAGDTDNELRVLSSLGPANLGASQTRWFTLLLKKNPQQLVQVAGSWLPWGQPAADFVFANGDAEMAHGVIAARSNLRVPVWGKSYTALTGLYFAEPSQSIKSAFVDALGDQTIGDRVGKPVNRDNQLAGDIWFYYASRYGEYLAGTRQDAPDDFLPAELEHSPASSNAYLSLGDFYLEHGDVRKAIEQYEYTLELTPARAEVHDKLALAYFRDKNRAQAVAQWKLSFAAQLNQVNNVRLTESFWADFGRALDHVRNRGVFQDVKSEVEQLLRAYLRRNGNYRSNALLHSAYVAAGDPAAATAWLLDLSATAPDPTTVLEDVAEVQWIPIASRAPIIQRILEAKLAAVAKAEGLEQENAKSVLWNWQLRWVKYLVDTKQYSRAADEVAALQKKAGVSDSAALVPYEMKCATQLGTLDTILSGYKSEPQSAPSAESLRIAARQILDGGDKQSARKILEFVFARQLEEHQLVATNFLGLAEIRIADGDVAGAVTLLKRLVLVAGDAYQNMDSSAAVFEKASHPAEALVFLEPLANATPWEPSFRLRLSKAQLLVAQDKNAAAQNLAKLSAGPENPYALRVLAATAMAGLPRPAEPGSVELKLLAGGAKSLTPAASDHPYFYDSRLAAAQNTPNARDKMEVLAKALADSPSREDARVPFFSAAVSIPADEVALSSIEELLQSRLIGRVAPGNSGDEETFGADEEADAGQTGVRSESSAALPPSQQSQLAHEVALALIRLDRLDEAAAYLKIAQNLERSTAERARITTQLLDVRARLRRQRTNAARQPVLHAELEQDRLVRPRMTARVETPGKSPAKAGRKP
jgi:hypothetical protein